LAGAIFGTKEQNVTVEPFSVLVLSTESGSKSSGKTVPLALFSEPVAGTEKGCKFQCQIHDGMCAFCLRLGLEIYVGNWHSVSNRSPNRWMPLRLFFNSKMYRNAIADVAVNNAIANLWLLVCAA